MQESPENWEFQLFGNTSSCQQDSSCSISHLGGIPCSSCAVLLESGLELAKALKSGVLSDAIIFRHDDFLGFVSILHKCFHWHDFIVEQTLFLSQSSLSMAINCEFILVGSGDSVFLSHVFRGLPHPHKAVSGLGMLENRLVKQLSVHLVLHVEKGHLLNSSSDTDVQYANSDFGSNDGTGFDS